MFRLIKKFGILTLLILAIIAIVRTDWQMDEYRLLNMKVDAYVIPPKGMSELAVDAYIKKHQQVYPDCTEHAAVWIDAKRHAAWRVTDKEYRKQHHELLAYHDQAERDALAQKDAMALQLPENERRLQPILPILFYTGIVRGACRYP